MLEEHDRIFFKGILNKKYLFYNHFLKKNHLLFEFSKAENPE